MAGEFEQDTAGNAAETKDRGNSGDDDLSGGGGADYLSGFSGDDSLYVGDSDTASGGTGEDHFYFGFGTGTSVITDFELGEDQIHLRYDEFTGYVGGTLDRAAQVGDDVVLTLEWTDVWEPDQRFTQRIVLEDFSIDDVSSEIFGWSWA
ncbi:hypothetical protein [Marinovum algicola]|uniref:hypothetical protein n=1 Tax=Marinovum algicola TaxID=42444 RepID=UPI0024B9896C|nr:hypothetical protein [Marinovum algicola]